MKLVPSFLVVLSLGAVFSSIAVAQSSNADIDFSSELNRLDTVPSDDNRAGGWGSDLEAWKQGTADINERKRQEKLSALKSKCRPYWPNPSTIKCTGELPRSAIVLTTKRVDPKVIARNKCSDLMTQPSRFNSCVHEKAREIERAWAKQEAESLAIARRAKENRRRKCVATRDYCAAIQADVTAGKVPKKSFPGWDKQDALDLNEAAKVIDAELQARMKDLDAWKKNADLTAAKDKQAIDAYLQKQEQDAIKRKLLMEKGAKAQCGPCECAVNWGTPEMRCVQKEKCSQSCSKTE